LNKLTFWLRTDIVGEQVYGLHVCFARLTIQSLAYWFSLFKLI